MSEPARSDVTQLLEAICDGDARASRELLPLVYDALHELASARMAHEAPGHTLQPTALVHEAYLRLVGDGKVVWNGKRHFFGAAAQAMRRILVDRARARGTAKRGGGQAGLPLREDALIAEPDPLDMLALDEALARLGKRNPRWSEIVELRFFAGLSIEETAAAMGLSASTVKDQWAFARAWMHRELAPGDGKRDDSGVRPHGG